MKKTLLVPIFCRRDFEQVGQGKVRDIEIEKTAICADMTVLYVGIYDSAALGLAAARPSPVSAAIKSI